MSLVILEITRAFWHSWFFSHAWLVFVHNNLGRPECFLKRLFSMFLRFLFRKAQHKAPPCQKLKFLIFKFNFFFRHKWAECQTLQFREGRDKGIRRNVSFFYTFFLQKNFCIFFHFLMIFKGGTGVCRQSRWVGIGLSQALPDLWSPRVWFTFRNSKDRWGGGGHNLGKYRGEKNFGFFCDVILIN